ncbi:MAG TPA: MAPEG family protein [Burkholderiaceae bacterium]|nr:MAPEG family protein [Burkholderiaceae bacterium]
MTVAYWCVLAAAILPLIATGIAKGGGERYNNRHPRAWLDKQGGYRARAAAAQANSFEAFPFFAAAVIVAHLTHAPQVRLDLLAVAFVVARIAYVACYVADWHWARSLVWLVGWIVCIAIFVSGVIG